MNESYFESIFAIFDDKPPFFCLFWTLFGQFLGNFPIRPVLMIPWLLNWIIFWIESADFFELINILNWILDKAILNRILNESSFGKIQTLNWIRLGIAHHYILVMSNSVLVQIVATQTFTRRWSVIWLMCLSLISWVLNSLWSPSFTTIGTNKIH